MNASLFTSFTLKSVVRTFSPPKTGSAALELRLLLLLLGAVVAARVAEDEEQHQDERHERAREHELHLELVPPHPLPKLPPRPVKVIRLKPKVLRLVHEQLDLPSRSSTFSMLSIMIFFTSLTCACTRLTLLSSSGLFAQYSICARILGPNDRSSECAMASFALSPYWDLNSSLTRSRHANGICRPYASSATTR